MNKTLYTLNVDGYAPEIAKLTFPLMRYYANKIGAKFEIIDVRKFPNFPVTYEKFQIYDRANDNRDDWSIYLDADTLVHPETPDWTQYLPFDTCAHYGKDFAGVRWRPNDWFRRDGRNIGSCNWNTVASRWCRDIWRPAETDAPIGLVSEIFPTQTEINSGLIDPEHLIDDYLCSCNIARFGLKFVTILELQKTLGFDPEKTSFYYHEYTIDIDEKATRMRTVLKDTWKIAQHIRNII